MGTLSNFVWFANQSCLERPYIKDPNGMAMRYLAVSVGGLVIVCCSYMIIQASSERGVTDVNRKSVAEILERELLAVIKD